MNGDREPNFRLRRARTVRGQTQQQVAEALSVLLGYLVEQEYVGRVERGVITWPNAKYRTAFRTHFGVASDAQLGFYCRRSRPAPGREDEDMRRRVVLTGLPVTGLATSWPLAALVEDAATEAPSVPRRVGAEEIEQVRMLGVDAFEMDKQFGDGWVRETLVAQLRWSVSLLDAHVDRAARAELHSAVGALARYAGWSSHDMGADTAAHRCCEVALRCSEAAEDWSLRAKSLIDWSRVVEYSGDGETALTLAQEAMVRPDRLTQLERACVSAAEATAHGRRGDVGACLAAIGRTEDYVAAADPADESPAMVAYLTMAELADSTGNALWPLAMRGHAVADTAARLRAAADTCGPDIIKQRTLNLTRLATLQFAHGDPDEAVVVANTALDMAGTARSRKLRDDLVILRHASQHRGVAGVAELRQRLDQMLTSV
ncbi:MAG: helix-turn-helix domain-containing protein [Pseudonocardiales bacterium]